MKKSLIMKNTFSALFVFLFSFMSEKSDLFKTGKRTGELVLKDGDMLLTVPLSRILSECQQEKRRESGSWVDLVNFLPVSWDENLSDTLK